MNLICIVQCAMGRYSVQVLRFPPSDILKTKQKQTNTHSSFAVPLSFYASYSEATQLSDGDEKLGWWRLHDSSNG